MILDQDEILKTLEEAKLSETESTAFFDALIKAGVRFEEPSDDDQTIEDLNYETGREIKLMDPVKQYLTQIGEFALLTSKEENGLAQLIREGQIAQIEIDTMMKDCDYRITSDQAVMVSELQKTVDAGNQAKNELVSANLRLVVSIAKKY